MKTNKIILTGFFLALALILPQIFHPLNLGQVISPIHFPVLLCGLILGYQYGLLCGIVAPILAGILFLRPPLYPTGIAMAIELGIYGFLSGLLFHQKNLSRNTIVRLYASLVVAMIVGRLASSFVNSFLVLTGLSTVKYWAYIKILFVIGLPGIVLQLLVIPPIVLRLVPQTEED